MNSLEQLLENIKNNNINTSGDFVPEIILNDYSSSLKKCSIYESLFAADNLNEILNVAEIHLKNPIFIVDTSYSILCRSSTAYSVTSCIEEHNNKYYLICDTVNLMKKHKCIDNIYNSNKAFFHYDNDKLIFCSIKINNVTTGYICVLEREVKFKDSDLELVNILSKTISIFTQKEHFFISNSGLCDEYYLIDLLSNKIDCDDIKYIEERLKNSRFLLKENYVVLSIPYVQKYKDYRYNFGLKELMQSCKNIFKNCLSTYYENNIIFLVSSDTVNVLTDSVKNSFLEFLNLNKLKCGISLSFDNLINIHDFVLQSIYALKICEKINNNDILAYFEDYIDFYLFNMVDSKCISEKLELRNLVHPLLNKLISYDKSNNSELFNTLTTYIQKNRNASKTAESLNINRSTFFYRFHKIETVLSVDINSIIYKLEFSIRLLKYISIY